MILANRFQPCDSGYPGIDLPQVMTSRDILRMDDWNFDCLTVIGGGVIGVEIATIFAALRFPRDAFGAGKPSAGVDGSDDFRADGSESAF